MATPLVCPACGAGWREGRTCRDDFKQMLAWEVENQGPFLEVHHLTVLCYHLQHPTLYSPEGLCGAQGLLVDFLIRRISPVEVRRRDRTRLDSSKRKYKIKGTPASFGSYQRPVHWTMTARDVIAGGVQDYPKNVRAWAQAVYEALRLSKNLPPD